MNETGEDARSRFARKRRLRRWLTNILFFVAGVGLLCGILAMIDVTPFLDFKDPASGVSIRYPNYWKVLPPPGPGVVAVFVTPLRHEMDTFAENVNITVREFPRRPTISLGWLTKTTINQIVGTFGDNIEILDSSDITAAGRAAHRFIYVGRIEGVADPNEYMHVWTAIGNRAYIFTYLARESEFRRYYGHVKKMLRSWRINPPR